MSLTPSTMLNLGTQASDFSLPATDGKIISLNDFQDKQILVVMFICNHCPYVIHVRDELIKIANDYKDRDVGFVAINSNDSDLYPEDSFDNMKKFAEKYKFPFTYAYDESQEVAKAYKAACTPDVFVFDDDRKLVYRGQIDDSRPGNGKPLTGTDLRSTLDSLLDGMPVSQSQKPSTGCNIKWKPGNEPDYY